jgi:arginase family enzyme
VHLRILDLDGSLSAQATLQDVAAWSSVASVPLRDLGPRLRLWSRAATMRQAGERLAAAAPATGTTLTLIGSGDFHHLAVPLIEQAREPVTVVHFDNHPDWVRWAPRWHCGSWVNQVLRLPQVTRVVTLGPSSEDLVRPELKGGNLAALGAGRIALFPWQHAPSRVFRRIADGAGHRYANGHLVWRNLAGRSSAENLAAILATIETDAIWLTIDKDVLAESEALTNWDQGLMPLAALRDLIAAIGARKRIVGADLCGEFSPPVMSNPFKRIESRIDRPQRVADAEALARNEAVNRELLRTIHEAAAC